MYLFRINKFTIIFLYLSFFPQKGFTQDLFNIKNSTLFANYLYRSKEFELAAWEYERITFLDPDNEKAKLFLIKSYCQTGNYTLGIERAEKFFPVNNEMPSEISYEYGRLLILNKSFDKSRKLLDQTSSLRKVDKLIFQISTGLFEGNWKTADNLIMNSRTNSNPVIEQYKVITNEALNFKYKNPYVSMGLSALVPGMGKVYSGYWKDGLVAFLFVAITSWQAYRGFDKNGVNSIYGWIYGTIGTGFYIGNIYGSGKAANKYNYLHEHKLKRQIENIFDHISQ